MNCGAVVNAPVLNHRLTDRSSAGSVGSPVEVGPLCPEAGESVVVGGLRDGDRHARLQREDARHRPVADDRAEDAPRLVRRFAPNGMSHTADETNTCGMSPVE